MLIWTFYKSFIIPSMAITICCIDLIWEANFRIIGILFWFKIATLGLIFCFVNSYKSKQYYYYQNLGISKVMLWVTTLVFDVFVFILLVILAYKFK